MTMYSFISAPRQGHMDRFKRRYAYLDKMRNLCIWVQKEEFEYSELTHHKFDWGYSVHGEVKELLPDDLPTP